MMRKKVLIRTTKRPNGTLEPAQEQANMAKQSVTTQNTTPSDVIEEEVTEPEAEEPTEPTKVLTWPPSTDFVAVLNKLPTTSAKIRYMASCGYSKTQISKHLGILYQHARNVLNQHIKRPIGGELPAPPRASTVHTASAPKEPIEGAVEDKKAA
jgi:hypothetical protein